MVHIDPVPRSRRLQVSNTGRTQRTWLVASSRCLGPPGGDWEAEGTWTADMDSPGAPHRSGGAEGSGGCRWARLGLSEERSQGERCKRRRQGCNPFPVFSLY